MQSSVAARKREEKEYIKKYRTRKISAEEEYELDAAFGKGTHIVDVLTVERVR